MKDNKKKSVSPTNFVKLIFKDSFVYGAAGILSKSLVILTFPLLARSYSIEDYGIIDLLYFMTNLLTTFFIFGQDSAIFRFFHIDNCNLKRSKMITGSVTLQIILSIAFIFSLWIIKAFFYESLNISTKVSYLINIVLLSAPFGVVYANAQAILRLTFKRIEFLILSLGFTISNLIIVFFSTSISDPEIIFLFELHLFIWIIFGLLSAWYIKNWITIPDLPLVSKKMISYGVPMGLITLIGTGQPFLERIVINQNMDPEALGLYAAAAKISLIITLLVGAFQNAFGPFLMSYYQKKDIMISFNFLLKIYIVILSCIVLVLAACGQPILSLLAGERYFKGSIVIFPLVFASFIKSIGVVIGVGLILSNKTFIKLIIYVFSIIVSLIAMIYFCKHFGVVGIAIGVIIGNSVTLLLEVIMSQHFWAMKWNYLVVYVFIAINAVIGYALTFIDIKTIIGLCSLLLALSFVLFVGWLMISKDEKQYFKDIFSMQKKFTS